MIRDRIVEFKRVPASSLVPNPKNFRTHNDAQRDMLRNALDDVGFAGAELVRVLPDGRLMLIDGHLRQEEMTGHDIPVLVTDLDAHEADALLATFDPIGRLAGIDAAKAQALIDELIGTHDYAADLLSAIKQNDNLAAILATLSGAKPDIELPDGKQDEPPPQDDHIIVTVTLSPNQWPLIRDDLIDLVVRNGGTVDVS